MKKQKAPLLKSKFGRPFGFSVPQEIKPKTLGSKAGVGFDPARFKTQHKG